MRLVLVRHGQTPSNVLGLLDTAPPGPGLTDRGAEQARVLVDTLAGESIEQLWTSTARRAQQTAAPLAADRRLDLNIRDGLREIAAGDWEMAGDLPTIELYLDLVRKWMFGQLELRSPGPTGESGSEVLARFDAVIDELSAGLADPSGPGEQCAVVVAHGAVLRVWACARAANLDAEFGVQHRLMNTGVIVMEGDPKSGWACLSWTGRPVVDGVPVEPSSALD